ncbi:protein MAM3, putative [Plasmodium malariae]|uniref:Protein MAM3, putative n=1 Tax=Plasmodium malariae TaxID=5858 RepID=A0A1D3JMS6_PLAMA|nr:protein MAM3, putative [Plasmodium malariae]SBT87976.1 protein MAM3, putative [Plasmodium malariae]
MQLWLLITCIVACGILSALFSGLSLGIMMLDTLQLNLLILVSEKNKKELSNAKNARKILPLRNNTNEILVTFITANVMVNSAFSLLLGELTDGFTSFIVSTLIITIFGEIIPQSVCSKHGLAIGGFFAPLIHCLKFCLYIFAKPTSLILDRFVGKNVLNTYDKKQLKALVDVHKSAAGILNEDEAKIVVSALELSQYKVIHIMTDIDYVFGIDYNSFINYHTIKKILKSGFSRIPVLNRNISECVVGLIHIKDLINIWFGINKIIFDTNSLVQCRKRKDKNKHMYYRKGTGSGIFHMIKLKSKKIRIANKICSYDDKEMQSRSALGKETPKENQWKKQKPDEDKSMNDKYFHVLSNYNGKKRNGTYDTNTEENDSDLDSTIGKDDDKDIERDNHVVNMKEKSKTGNSKGSAVMRNTNKNRSIYNDKGVDENMDKTKHSDTDSERGAPENSDQENVKISIEQMGKDKGGVVQKKKINSKNCKNRNSSNSSNSSNNSNDGYINGKKKKKKRVKINVGDEKTTSNNYYSAGDRKLRRDDEKTNEIVNPSKLREKKRKKIKKSYKNPYASKNKNVDFVEFLSDQMMDSDNDNSSSLNEQLVFMDVKKKIRMYNKINKSGHRIRRSFKDQGSSRDKRGNSNGNSSSCSSGNEPCEQRERMESKKQGYVPPASIMHLDLNNSRSRYGTESVMIKENLNKEKNMELIFLDIKNYIRVTRHKDIEIPVKYILKHIGRYVYGVDYDESILSLLSFFKSANNHIVVVRKVMYNENTDPTYSHIGIITLEDVIEMLLQEEISDEFDFRNLKKFVDIPSNFVWNNSNERMKKINVDQGKKNFQGIDKKRKHSSSKDRMVDIKKGTVIDKHVTINEGVLERGSDKVDHDKGRIEASCKVADKTADRGNIKTVYTPNDALVIHMNEQKIRKKSTMLSYQREVINFLKENVYFKYIDTQLISKCIQKKKIKTLTKDEYLLKENTFLNYAIILMKGKVRNVKNDKNILGGKCIIGLEALGPCNIIELFNGTIEKRINVIKKYEEEKKKKKKRSLFFRRKDSDDQSNPKNNTWTFLKKSKKEKNKKNIYPAGQTTVADTTTEAATTTANTASTSTATTNKPQTIVIQKNINILFKKWYTQHVYFNKCAYVADTACEYMILSKNEYMDMIIECYNNEVDEIIGDN